MLTFDTRQSALLLLSEGVTCALIPHAATSPQLAMATQVNFVGQIAPLFSKYCGPCHGSPEAEAGVHRNRWFF